MTANSTNPSVEKIGEVAVVTIPLEKLDMSTASDFKKMMTPLLAQNKKIVLDLEGVAFVDSSGLGAILSVLRELSADGGDLKLCRVQKRVRIMFELVRMHRILNILNTPEEAVAAFSVA